MLRRALYSSKSLARQNNHQVGFFETQAPMGNTNYILWWWLFLAFTLVSVSHHSFILCFNYFFPPTWLTINYHSHRIHGTGIFTYIYNKKSTKCGSIWCKTSPFSPIFIIGKGSEMLVGAICINSINVVMQRFHRDLQKVPPLFLVRKKSKTPRWLATTKATCSNPMMSISTKIVHKSSLPSQMFLRKVWWDTVKSPWTPNYSKQLLNMDNWKKYPTCFLGWLSGHRERHTRDAFIRNHTPTARPTSTPWHSVAEVPEDVALETV